jgi:hypothetical protein
MPSGEICIKDPGGYGIQVAHWGKEDHEAWDKRVSEKT